MTWLENKTEESEVKVSGSFLEEGRNATLAAVSQVPGNKVCADCGKTGEDLWRTRLDRCLTKCLLRQNLGGRALVLVWRCVSIAVESIEV